MKNLLVVSRIDFDDAITVEIAALDFQILIFDSLEPRDSVTTCF